MYYAWFPNDSFATGKNKETDIPMKTQCHHPDKILLSETKPHCLHMALRAKRQVRREQCEDHRVLSSSFDFQDYCLEQLPKEISFTQLNLI